MTEATGGDRGLPWHEALRYAVTGQRRDDPAEGSAPELEQLAQQLRSEYGPGALSRHIRDTLAAGRPWPHPVPADLMTGLGYAQFSAALNQLIRLLGLAIRGSAAPPDQPGVRAAEPLSAEIRRLLDEVPPHHGS